MRKPTFPKQAINSPTPLQSLFFHHRPEPQLLHPQFPAKQAAATMADKKPTQYGSPLHPHIPESTVQKKKKQKKKSNNH